VTIQFPLRILIPLILLAFGLIASVVSLSYERRLDERNIEQGVTERAEFIGTKLSAMCAHFAESGMTASAHREVALSAMNPDLRLAMVFGGDDRVQFASQSEMENRAAAETPAAGHQALISRARRRMSGEVELSVDRNSLVGAFPFLLSPQGVSPLRSEAVGIVFLDYDLSHPKATARANANARVALASAVLLALAATFSVIFHRILTARVNRLVTASEKLAAGHLDVRADIRGGDELAQLGKAFDHMAAQLQRRDAQLFASEQQFRQFADNVAEIFWLCDAHATKPLYVNAGFERVFAVPTSEFLASLSAWHDAIHPEDRQAALAAFACEHERGHDIIYRIVRPDGGIRWLRDQSFPVMDETGRIVRVAGIAEDITEQKLAAADRQDFERKLQETQRLESLGVLAGGIAHDFNNLLTGILGNASLARLALPPSDEAQQYLGEIESVAVRAADLCKQMLAYSGKGRFQIQALDLSALVQDTAQLLHLTITKNAILRINLASDLPAVHADPTQLRQVIMNLIINASEALGGKSGTITLNTGLARVDATYAENASFPSDVTPGDYVYLEVSDNGIGMSPETQARIFEPFFTTKFTGRGLGLSAVLGIVRGHRGVMKVYSEVGKGTMFKLLFPAITGTASPLKPQPGTADEWRGTGTILVVDDEDTVRTVVSRMLETMGFTVVVAKDGSEAVSLLRSMPDKITGVLMDLTMPRMGGEDAFREMRAAKPDLRVILMSGFNEQDAINRFTGKGLAGFLQKPFKPDALRAKLREMLGATSRK
jgi:PAS domain S-box-containing protein